MQYQNRGRRTIGVADGLHVAFLDEGRGRDVVLIHGALVNADDMRLSLLPSFGRHFRTVVFDRPGHGLSSRRGIADASLWRQAAILRDAAGALGLQRPLLVGHSFGGALALAWSLAFPDEVAGVLALAPICFPEVRLEHLLFGPRAVPFGGVALARSLNVSSDQVLLPTLWRAMFLPQAMPAEFTRQFSFDLAGESLQTVRGGEDAALLPLDLARLALRYGESRTPTRVLGGSADLVVNNVLQGRQAATAMPCGSFRAIPGSGHMLHHVHPQMVLDEARDLSLSSEEH